MQVWQREQADPKLPIWTEILWETNAMPEGGEIVHTWTPSRGLEALADIEPLMHLLGLHSRHHPELWARVHAMEEALRGPNDRSILGGMRSLLQFTDAMSRLAEIAKGHETADVVVTVQILRCDAEGANFWIHSHGRDGIGGSQRHEGTWHKLKKKGVDYTIEGTGANSKVTLSLDRYFANKPIPHEIIGGPTETPTVGQGHHSPCFFLRRIPLEPAGKPGDIAEG